MNGWILNNAWVLVAAALAIGACSEPKVAEVETKARWTYVENPDIKVVAQGDYAFDIDFGTVALGARPTLEIRVTNEGGVPLTISPFASLDGFVVDIPSDATVNVADTRTILLSFSPSDVKSYNSTGALSVTDHPAQSLRLALDGVGQKPEFSCNTSKLDFGNVVKGGTSTLSFDCRNDSLVEGVLIVSPIEGLNKALFGHPFSGDNGRLALQAGQSSKIDVTYKADLPGLASANLEILREVNNDEPARVAYVRLQGFTVDRAIDCSPTNLDFGFVAPGQVQHLDITCFNHASEPFEITSISLDPVQDSRFSWSPADSSFVIPPFANDLPGEKTLEISFAPTPDDIGHRKNASLVLLSNDETSPRIDVSLTGFAGGPVISCAPSQINFGPIDKDVPITRSFTCSNLGIDDPERTDDALVVTNIESTKPDEFSAVVRGELEAGYPVGGLFTVDVTYHPVDHSPDSAQIRISSNDTARSPDDPYFIAVYGFGHDLPPCEFVVAPEKVLFGNVPRNESRTLDFSVRNLSPENECLIQSLRLAPTCAPEFSLPEGSADAIVLPKDEELRFPVKFAPGNYEPTPFTCDVLFDISDPSNRQQSVSVRGTSVEPCLLVNPSELDFGSVRPGGCSSSSRKFEALNICETPIVFDRLELGEGSSKEFYVLVAPPSNHRLAPGDSITFELVYRPEDEGFDRGSVLLYVDDAKDHDPYMAALSGTGDNNAIQTDRFRQDDRAKVDILWVIDNSLSMAPAQEHLAANVGSFLRIADAQGVDYHIGVTTTGITMSTNINDECPGGVRGNEDGRLFPVDGAARGHPRYITPDTPNLEAVWAENFRVGICHGYEYTFEPALRALTPPVIDRADDPRHDETRDGNLGFLRPDAYLSIISVSDEIEQSFESVSHYYYELLKIKGVRNPGLFGFHAITGDPITGCVDGIISAEPNDRTFDMVKRAGGVFESFCTADWSKSLEKMASVAFGYKSCFPLANVPEDRHADGVVSDIDGEILVKSNGRPTASIGGEGDSVWSYNAAENSICFTPLYTPHPGIQIEVTYSAACGG